MVDSVERIMQAIFLAGINVLIGATNNKGHLLWIKNVDLWTNIVVPPKIYSLTTHAQAHNLDQPTRMCSITVSLGLLLVRGLRKEEYKNPWDKLGKSIYMRHKKGAKKQGAFPSHLWSIYWTRIRL